MVIYVLVTKNQDSGFRIQIRDGIHRTRPLLQSAREPDVSTAKRNAEKVFGRLEWRDPRSVDPNLPDFIRAIAVVEAAAGVW